MGVVTERPGEDGRLRCTMQYGRVAGAKARGRVFESPGGRCAAHEGMPVPKGGSPLMYGYGVPFVPAAAGIFRAATPSQRRDKESRR